MELVHETWKIKGLNIVGSIDWMEIGDETGLPFEDHPGELHYINGFDKAGNSFMCIAEIEFGEVKNIFWDYLIGKYSK